MTSERIGHSVIADVISCTVAQKSIRVLYYKEIPLTYKFDFNERLGTCKAYDTIFFVERKSIG